jgi:haloalkane dehalogenase
MSVLRTPESRFADLPGYSFASHYVTVTDEHLGSLRMHYLDEGDPDGPPVLILHGEPTWSYMFRETVPVLASEGMRVVVPDLIGFGKSDKPSDITDHSYESHVRWLSEFVSQAGLQDAVLVGHDWGGLLGLRLVTTIDGLACAYVASNHGFPTGDEPPSDALRQRQYCLGSRRSLDVGAMVARSCTTVLDPEVWRAYDAPYPDDRYKAGPRALPTLLPTRPDHPSAQAVRDARATLATSPLPFLTIYGERDPIDGAADAVFHDLVPGASGQPHVRLVDAGHNAPEDAGETFGTVIRNFAAALSACTWRRSAS